VDDALLVRVREPVAELGDQAQRICRRHGAVLGQPAEQVAVGHEL
jgi:hypothetical protein